MDQQLMQQFQKQLLDERKHLEDRINRLTEDQLSISMEDSVGELSSIDNHPADLGSEMFERAKDLALREDTKNQIAIIDDALAHMEAGDYGICDSCGKEIDIERLKAVPSTTTCLECRKREESLPDRHIRPIEEDVIVPPFGGLTHDRSPRELNEALDQNEYDGEDAWQEVAQYGTAESPQDMANSMAFPIKPDFDEDRGFVEDVDNIPYEKDIEGRIYKDFGSYDRDDYPGAWEERVKEQVEERFNRDR